MHGWNDPIDPERIPWRAEPPTDDPAWLTDRPAPRSSYLFGDDPVEPSDGWYRDQPTEQWRSDAAEHPVTEAYRQAEQPYPTTEQDWYDASGAPHQQTGRHHRDDEPTATDWPAHHAAPQESAYAYDDRPDWYTDQAVGYTDRAGAYAEPVVSPHYGPPQTGHRELAGVDEPALEPTAATVGPADCRAPGDGRCRRGRTASAGGASASRPRATR